MDNNWKLIDERTKQPDTLPHTTTTFRGDIVTVTGGRPPHKPGSTGRIFTNGWDEFFPSVCNLRWEQQS